MGASPWPGFCVVILGKALYSCSASFHIGVVMGSSELQGIPDKMRRKGVGVGNLRFPCTPSRKSGCAISSLFLVQFWFYACLLLTRGEKESFVLT